MTATEELRALLDERGMEYKANDIMGLSETCWGSTYAFQLSPNSALMMRVTPEQAIEATLERGTCSIRGGECDQCGAHIHRDAVLFWVPAGGGMRTVESRDVSYCPNCGRKVVK